MPDVLAASPAPTPASSDKVSVSRRDNADASSANGDGFAAAFHAASKPPAKPAPRPEGEEQATPDPAAANSAAVLPQVVGNQLPLPVTPTLPAAPAAAQGTSVATTGTATDGKTVALPPGLAALSAQARGAGQQGTGADPGAGGNPGKLPVTLEGQAATQAQNQTVPGAAQAADGSESLSGQGQGNEAKPAFSLDNLGKLDAGAGSRERAIGGDSLTATPQSAATPVPPEPPRVVASNAAGTQVLKLDTQLPLHSPAFADGLGQQIVVLTGHGIQEAQMTLNPPDLGPVEVRISLRHEEASVQLAAANGMTREVIQDALPRLRELMSQSGVKLSDANVFAQLPQRDQSAQANAGRDQSSGRRGDSGGQESRREERVPLTSIRRRVGLIDAYA